MLGSVVMSDHYASLMLNKVLYIAKDFGIIDAIGKDKFIEFTKEIVLLGLKNDCSRGEILNGIMPEIGVCWYCLEKSDNLVDGFCNKCSPYK